MVDIENLKIVGMRKSNGEVEKDDEILEKSKIIWPMLFGKESTYKQYVPVEKHGSESSHQFQSTIFNKRLVNHLAGHFLEDIRSNDKKLWENNTELTNEIQRRLKYLSTNHHDILGKSITTTKHNNVPVLLELLYGSTSSDYPFDKRISEISDNVRRAKSWKEHFNNVKLKDGFNIKPMFLDEQYNLLHHPEANLWAVLHNGTSPVASFGATIHNSSTGPELIIRNSQGLPIWIRDKYNAHDNEKMLSEFQKKHGEPFGVFIGKHVLDYSKKNGVASVFGGQPYREEGESDSLSIIRKYRQLYKRIGLQEQVLRKGKPKLPGQYQYSLHLKPRRK